MRVRVWYRCVVAGLLLAAGLAGPAAAAEETLTVAAQPIAVGPSGLPVPRFVTLKSSRVNVRVGPGQNYDIAWVFVRPGLPVEVIQEYDNWRRIRDSDGTVGWVFQSLLSGQRQAVVSPWDAGTPIPITAEPADDGRVTAFLEPGVLAVVDRCSEGWCRLSDARFVGWIRQDRLWGVYPHEEID
jgi:SH3-like domain-containing protein